MVPETAIGRVLGGLVAITGIGTLALFSGLITVGFLDQLRIRRERANDGRVATQAARAEDICPHCGAAIAREKAAA